MSLSAVESMMSQFRSVVRRFRGVQGSRRRSKSLAWASQGMETLEGRRMPATLVGATTVKYQDADGDDVTVTLSKPVLTTSNANTIFKFNTGNVNGTTNTKQQLLTIDLTSVAAGATVTNITTSAVRNATTGGDGFMAIGQINATGIDLGTVTIDGDLGRIMAGDATTTTTGLAGLTVQSLGRFGTFTGAINLNTVVQGKLGSLSVKSDVNNAFINVGGGVNGQIGPITIDGSLLGLSSQNSGRIAATGDIGIVTIKGDIEGGANAFTGSIQSGGKIASLTVNGSLFGGTGAESGRVSSALDMGAVIVLANVEGGSGAKSGSIHSNGKLTGVKIDGSLLGGTGKESGKVSSSLDMGAVTIGGDVIAGSGGVSENSGAIFSLGKLASVTINGRLEGGAQELSGAVFSSLAMGPVIVKGNVNGGAGERSGSIHSESPLGTLTMGATGVASAYILS